MLGKVSSDQPRVGLSGSGALSHVYVQHPPLRCNIPETQGLYYDDGNKLLLSPTSDQVLSWKTSSLTQYDPPDSDSISEGPVLSIRYSLDRKVIGIQRSNNEIHFKNRETGETFSRRCRPDSESILGFFWTDCPSCDIIFIKTSGIDLLSFEPELNTLRLVEAKRFNVTWYVYTHESRLLLLASGMQCTILSGFQFSSAGIIRLPKFEMTMAKVEVNQKPVLAAEDVHIVTIYGRIYCLQLDRAGMLLNLYRFYRDAVMQQGTLAIYSSRIAVSVVDNVLLVHQVDAKVVILYDIFLDSLAPISAPLPLLMRGKFGNNRQTVSVDDNLTSAYGGMIYGDSWTFLVPDLICDVDNGLLWKICLDLEAISASSSDVPSVLEFLQRRRSFPSTIKSLSLGLMRTIIFERRPISMVSRAIDVLVASYSHSVKTGNAPQLGAKTTEKFQHSGELASKEPGNSDGDARLETAMLNFAESFRKSSSGDLQASGAQELVDNTVGAQTSDTDMERSPLQSEVVEHNSSPVDSCISNSQGSQFSNVAISPDDMYHFVFASVEDEMGGDPAYLVAAIVEFFRSVSKEKFKVHPNLYVMTIQLLARNNHYAELGLFVINKILEPSKEVALQLIDSGRQNVQTRKLGVDMLRQLSLHHDYVGILLEDGYYLEALRYARKNQNNIKDEATWKKGGGCRHTGKDIPRIGYASAAISRTSVQKVITVRPSLFLEAAISDSSSQHLAAVLRFFSDFTPGFKDTSEYSRYHRILSEIS